MPTTDDQDFAFKAAAKRSKIYARVYYVVKEPDGKFLITSAFRVGWELVAAFADGEQVRLMCPPSKKKGR